MITAIDDGTPELAGLPGWGLTLLSRVLGLMQVPLINGCDNNDGQHHYHHQQGPSPSSSSSSSSTTPSRIITLLTRLRDTTISRLPTGPNFSYEHVHNRDETEPLSHDAPTTSTSSTCAAGSTRKRSTSPNRRIFSSQDYEDEESEVARRHLLETQNDCVLGRSHGFVRLTRRTALIRWLIILLIAIITESIYICISLGCSYLIKSQQSSLNHIPNALAKYLTKLAFSLFYASIAFYMTYLIPSCSGSGIPEVKVFLNGIKLPEVHSLRCLCAKAVGTIFAVSAGLPVGKYGPMIHIGSIVAGFLSRRLERLKAVEKILTNAGVFSSHKERRDLVVSGAAAGVTAAFGAPVGGLLLAWEEGSSYWSLKLTWRVFFCAMATLVYTTLVAGSRAVKTVLTPSYIESYAGPFPTIWKLANFDLFLVAAMGIVAGAMGAGFTRFHRSMYQFRSLHVFTWQRQWFEVLCVTWLVITVSFVASYTSEPWSCHPLPPNDASLYEESEFILPYFNSLQQLTCPEGQYNEVASLFLNDGVTAIRLLFHLPPLNPTTGDLIFSNRALLIFVLPYLVLLEFTFGFFVPQLLVGAAFGRIIIQMMVSSSNYPSYTGQVQIFALMGSAAFVGGISQMVLSMTMIMVEVIGDIFLLIPFATALITSHWIGALFSPSAWDMIIQLKGYPFLEPDPPKWSKGLLCARDLPTTRLVCLHPIEKVERIQEVLQGTQHSLFPLVYPPGHEKEEALFGTILRSTLIVLLQHKAFSPSPYVNTDPDQPGVVSRVPNSSEIKRHYVKLHTREINCPTVHMQPQDLNLWVDLRPCCNLSNYLITQDSSLNKVYRLFRGLGLRHLLVVDACTKVTGIISRSNLTTSALEQRLQEMRTGSRPTNSTWSLPESEWVRMARIMSMSDAPALLDDDSPV